MGNGVYPDHKWPQQQYDARLTALKGDVLLTPIVEMAQMDHLWLTPLGSADGAGLQQEFGSRWAIDVQRGDAIAAVLNMTSVERSAWINGMMQGEGHWRGEFGEGQIVFTQKEGPVLDAFRLACFLEGIRTSERLAPSYNSTGLVAHCTLSLIPMEHTPMLPVHI